MSESRDGSMPLRPRSSSRRDDRMTRGLGDGASRTKTSRLTSRQSAALGGALALLALAPVPATSARTKTEGHTARSHRAHARSTDARRRGKASRGSVKVNDHAHLRLRKAFGAVLLEEGSASGTLPGRTTVRLVVRKRVTASFTIHAADGSIVGKGGAALHSAGRFASFGGRLKVTGGTGRYRHAHGSGRLYGVIDRRRHSLTVTTTGTLHY